MSARNPEDLTGLDEATIERIGSGTATRTDEIAKLEHWRRIAIENDDAERVEQLDMRLSVLRYGE